MSSDVPRRLPLPLRALAWSAGKLTIRGQGRAGLWLASRLLRGDCVYHGANGIALRVEPHDAFQPLMLLGLWERPTIRTLERFARPGSVVIDAGAHIGAFSLRAAQLVGPAGRIDAFECDPRAAERLRAHVRVNRCARVNVHEAALSNHVGRVQLYLPDRIGWSTLHRALWPTFQQEVDPDARRVTVSAITLDEHLGEVGVDPDRISVIKIDVEGSELDVLAGARETLRHTHAALIVEYAPRRLRATGSSPEELEGFLRSLGYTYSGNGESLRAQPDRGFRDVVFVKS
jgi:FkbM family methyltransferase